LTGELVATLGESQALEAVAHGLAPVPEGINARHKIEVLGNSQIFPEAKALGHVTNLALESTAFADYVMTEASAAASAGAQQAAEHADKRGLAAALGS